ncbi:MAG: hypothetical protein AABX51_04415 [Nanoarchaeota archaeon]
MVEGGREILNLVIQPPARVVLAFNPAETKDFGLDPNVFMEFFNRYYSHFRHVSPWGPKNKDLQPPTFERAFYATLAESESELLETILGQEKHGELDVIINGLGFNDDRNRVRLLRHLSDLKEGRVISKDTLLIDVGYDPSPQKISEEYKLGAADVLFQQFRSPKTGKIKVLTPERMINRVIDDLHAERIKHYAAGLEVLIGSAGEKSIEEELAIKFEEKVLYSSVARNADELVNSAVSRADKGEKPFGVIVFSDDLPLEGRIDHVQVLNELRYLPSKKVFVISHKKPDASTIARRAIETTQTMMIESPYDPEVLMNRIYDDLGIHRIPETSFRHSLNFLKWGGSIIDRMEEEGPKFVEAVVKKLKLLHRLGREKALLYDKGESDTPGWSIVLSVGGGPRADLTRRLQSYTAQDIIDDLQANSRTIRHLIGSLDGRILHPNEVYSLTEEQTLDSICIIPELPSGIGKNFIRGYKGRETDLLPLLIAHIYNPNQNINAANDTKARVIFMKDLPIKGPEGKYINGRICNVDPNDSVERGQLTAINAISAADVLEGQISRERLQDHTSQHLIEDSSLRAMAGKIQVYKNGNFEEGTLNIDCVYFIGPSPSALDRIITGGISSRSHPGSVIYADRNRALADPEIKPYLLARAAH